jgi:hypothetical protein
MVVKFILLILSVFPELMVVKFIFLILSVFPELMVVKFIFHTLFSALFFIRFSLAPNKHFKNH